MKEILSRMTLASLIEDKTEWAKEVYFLEESFSCKEPNVNRKIIIVLLVKIGVNGERQKRVNDLYTLETILTVQ